jgi:acetyl esterase/lipase
MRAWGIAIAIAVVVSPACASAPDERLDVVYDERFGEDTLMDVYLPEGDGPHPGVMFIHGGAWIAGDRGEYTQAAKRMSRAGYVAATIEYRLLPDGAFPKNVQDCFCALAHLRAHAAEYRLDPNRVAVVGYSAGGHLAAMIGLAADDPTLRPDCASGSAGAPNAVVAGSANYDLRGTPPDFWLAEEYLGGDPDDLPEVYSRASPITHVGPGKPPFLLVIGTDDMLIVEEQSHALRVALAAHGNAARVLEVKGGGHLLNRTADGQLAIEEADLTPEGWIVLFDFLERTVGRAP